MNPSDPGSLSESATSRKPLEESEKRASETQPHSFDKKRMEDKIVGIPPKESTDKPIRGLDNRPPADNPPLSD